MTPVVILPPEAPARDEQPDAAERRWVIVKGADGKGRIERRALVAERPTQKITRSTGRARIVTLPAPEERRVEVFTPKPSAQPAIRVTLPKPAAAPKPVKRSTAPPSEFDRNGKRRSPATQPGYGIGREPKNKGKVYGKDYLRPAEIEALLAACHYTTPVGKRTRALIVLLWRSGVRIHEALALEPHDLDPDTRRVHVRKGKGGKPRWAQMDDWGFEQLAIWMEFRKRYPAGPIFCVVSGASKGVEAPGASSIRRKLHELAKHAGITRRVHPHIFRHTLACELMLAKKPLSYIQHALGHASPAITATYLQGLGLDESLDDVSAREAPEFVQPAPPALSVVSEIAGAPEAEAPIDDLALLRTQLAEAQRQIEELRSRELVAA